MNDDLRVRISVEDITDLFVTFFHFLTEKDSYIWYFISPFKEIHFFSKSKYKLVRLFSILSPWVIFPYTLVAIAVYVCLWCILIVYGLFCFALNSLVEAIENLKTFWKNV